MYTLLHGLTSHQQPVISSLRLKFSESFDYFWLLSIIAGTNYVIHLH